MTTHRRDDAYHRSRYALANTRHRGRGGHRRRVRGRVLDLGARVVRPARRPRCGLPAAARPLLRGVARPGRTRPAGRSASPVPRSSPRWSRRACRHSSGVRGVRTRCSPASSRAPPLSSSSRSRSIATGRSRFSRSPRSRRPRPRGSTTGSIYYATVDPLIQIVRGVAMGISAVVFVAGGSVALHRALKRAGVLEGFPD